MADELEPCIKCGQPKRQAKDASFTQWIFFGSKSCACDTLPITERDKRPICPTCGKFVVTERKGSMTQWVIGPSLCRCATERADNDRENKLSAVKLKMPSQTVISDEALSVKEELLLDPAKFPSHRYRPILELGKGASGSVYLCTDRLLSKKVAVKTLHIFTAGQLISFQTEARAIATLKHPNIVELLDFGPTESGIPYMVLEYFDGNSLKDLIEKNGALPFNLVSTILIDLADGLSTAHSKGVYHRDISSSNILIKFDEKGGVTAKLIDFGVASIKREGDELAAASGDTITGTPAYMSPDVVAGGKYDQRSEIYSLGCLTFEALTGQVPFSGASPMETMSMHATLAPPTLNSINGTEFSPEVERLVSECLQKHPDSRYQSMLALRDDLERISKVQQEMEDAEVEPSTSPLSPDAIKNSSSFSRNLTISFAVFAVVVVFALLTVPGIIKGSDPKNYTQSLIEIGDKQAEVSTAGGAPNDYASAFHSYKQAAERGDKNAFVKLGQMYENGHGVEKNYSEAMRWYRCAIKENMVGANRNLGDLYYNGHGVPVDYPMALQLYRKAANADDLDAFNALGNMYENGQAVAKDTRLALDWYNRAALRGHPESMYDAGRLYDQGTGLTRRDAPKALRLFKLAAAEGHAKSQVTLGNKYFSGLSGVKRDYKVAGEYYQLAADQGNATGQDRIAYMHEMGLGVERDYDSAMEWYKKSAAQGEPKAMNSIGRLYDWGRGVKKDLSQAITWYQKAAEKGNLDSMKTLGLIYGAGRGVDVDASKAAKWLQAAADRGSHDAELSLGALLNEEGPLKDYKASMKWYQRAAPYKAEAERAIGYLYERGLGVPQNFVEARRRYQTGMERGDTRSIVSIGCLYEWGYGVKKDYREAMRYYRLAAEKNDPYGKYCVGFMYENALGVARDYKEAMKWFLEAAAQKEPNAQFELGMLYEGGLGVEKNYEEALKWYRMSAEQGNSLGKFHLGYMYEQGYGVEQDYKKAMELYLQPAEKGLGDAAYRISKMFENGSGVPADRDKANLWLRRAAANHSEDAIAELSRGSRN